MFLVVYVGENLEGIVFGYIVFGKDLLLKLVVKFEVGLVFDVIVLEVEGGNVIFICLIYFGKVFEKKIVIDGMLFVIVCLNNIVILEKDEFCSGDVFFIIVDVKDLCIII